MVQKEAQTKGQVGPEVDDEMHHNHEQDVETGAVAGLVRTTQHLFRRATVKHPVRQKKATVYERRDATAENDNTDNHMFA